MKKILLITIVIIFSLIFSSCSLIGITIGQNTNSDEISYYHDYYMDSLKTKSFNIEERDTICVTKTNGDSLVGEFIGYSELSNDEYSIGFIKKFGDLVYFPKLNDTLTLIAEKNTYCIFNGFEYEIMQLRNLKGEEILIPLDKPFIVVETHDFNLSRVQWVLFNK